MKVVLTSLLLTVSLAAGVAASQMSISQKGKKFSEKKIEVAAGTSIDFVNDDDITHNVHSSTKGQKFDLGAQQPGSTASHVFDKPGKLKVRCAIHPKMKMTVVVN